MLVVVIMPAVSVKQRLVEERVSGLVGFDEDDMVSVEDWIDKLDFCLC
jgi:hypothetical protein